MGTVQFWILGQHLVMGLFCLPFVLHRLYYDLFQRKRIDYVLFFFLFWLLYAGISLFWTVEEKGGFGSYWILFWNMTILFGLYSFAGKVRNAYESFAYGWMLLLCLTFPIAFWEIISGSHIVNWGDFNADAEMVDFEGNIQPRVFAAVTYKNLNSYVTLLCSALPILLSSFFHFEGKKRICSLVVSICAILIVLINSSRGGLLCVCINLLIFLFYYQKSKIPFKWIYSISFLFILYCIFILYWDKIFTHILLRLIGDGSSTVLSNMFASEGRYSVLFLGIELYINSFGFGWGVGSMPEAYASTRYELHYAHNLIIEVLVQYGFILYVFLCVLYISFKRLFQNNNLAIKIYARMTVFSFIPLSIIDDTYMTHPFIWAYFATILVLSNKLYAKRNEIT